MRDYEVQEAIRRVVRQELLWYRHYWGTVESNNDSRGYGRIRVTVEELRMKFWCAPRFTSGLSVPAQGDVVEIYFVEGNPSRPVWLGRVSEQKERLKNYSDPSTHVLFEDPKNEIHVVFNEGGNTLEIGNSNMQEAARANDPTNADTTTDPANISYLQVVCNMFGLPFSPPLVGKIKSGSSQVKVGDK